MVKFIFFLLLLPYSNALFGQNLDTILKENRIARAFDLSHLYIITIKKTPNEALLLKNEIKQKCTVEDYDFVDFIDKAYNLHKIGLFNKELLLIDEYINIVKKSNNTYLLAKAYSIKATRYEDLNEQNKAFEYNLYCYDALLKDPEQKYYQQSGILNSIAAQYYKFKDYEKCITVAKNAELLSKKFTANDKWFEIVNANLIGMGYLKNNEIDSALVWLNETFKRAKLNNNKEWYGIVTGNIGKVYYMQKNYTAAINYFKTGIDSCTKYRIWDNVGDFGSILVDCYLRTQQIELAKHALNDSKNAIIKQPSNELWQKYFVAASSYSKITQQFNAAFEYEDSIAIYNKQLAIEYDLSKKVRLETDWAQTKALLNQEIIVQKAKTAKWIFATAMTCAILVLIISMLYYNKQKHKHQVREKKLVEENTKISSELVLATEELYSFKNELRKKSDLIEKSAKEITTLEKQQLPISDLQLETLESLKKASILTEKDWILFQATFRKAFPGFLASLKINYKDLTPAEIRFLMFTKMDLTPKEMATTIGVGAEAIRNIRFRVRKKIDITGFDDLEAFTKSIS